MSQAPHQPSLLQRLVIFGEIGIGVLLLIMNLSTMNTHTLSFGLFLVVFGGLQLLAFQVERYNSI